MRDYTRKLMMGGAVQEHAASTLLHREMFAHEYRGLFTPLSLSTKRNNKVARKRRTV